MVDLRLGGRDLLWLQCFFPSLRYEVDRRRVIGELSVCASYDVSNGYVRIEHLGHDSDLRASCYQIRDVFDIEIRLAEQSVSSDSWPAVYEVGGRWECIAEKYGLKHGDLHMDSNGQCCLGIRWSLERRLSLERFLDFIVIPFFYRLAYVECRGLTAAKRDLWPEYSHGEAGRQEHRERMCRIAAMRLGRNQKCACGSGVKYKQCCLDEVVKTIAMHRKC